MSQYIQIVTFLLILGSELLVDNVCVPAFGHGAHRKGKKRFLKCGKDREVPKRNDVSRYPGGSHQHFLGHQSLQVHPTTPALLGFPWEASGLLWSLGFLLLNYSKIHIWIFTHSHTTRTCIYMGSRGEWNVFGGSIENRSERKEKCASNI